MAVVAVAVVVAVAAVDGANIGNASSWAPACDAREDIAAARAPEDLEQGCCDAVEVFERIAFTNSSAAKREPNSDSRNSSRSSSPSGVMGKLTAYRASSATSSLSRMCSSLEHTIANCSSMTCVASHYEDSGAYDVRSTENLVCWLCLLGHPHLW